jgi:hypothetical protein
MNIGSISSTDPTQLGALASVTRATAGVDADGDHDGSRTGSASVSPVGKLFSQLAQLQQSDPARFKTVLTDIANKLQAAGQQDGGAQGQALADLASKFQQAAQTGDLSSLKPAHHHHGHHRGAAAYQQTSAAGQSASSSSDPRSQIFDIINQVISTDLGSSSTTSAAA